MLAIMKINHTTRVLGFFIKTNTSFRISSFSGSLWGKWKFSKNDFYTSVISKVQTLDATTSERFPIGQTTSSQSALRSTGTSTSHSDNISCTERLKFKHSPERTLHKASDVWSVSAILQHYNYDTSCSSVRNQRQRAGVQVSGEYLHHFQRQRGKLVNWDHFFTQLISYSAPSLSAVMILPMWSSLHDITLSQYPVLFITDYTGSRKSKYIQQIYQFEYVEQNRQKYDKAADSAANLERSAQVLWTPILTNMSWKPRPLSPISCALAFRHCKWRTFINVN